MKPSYLVVLVRAVREVEPRDAHPGAEQLLEDLDGARLGAQGADDLSFCFLLMTHNGRLRGVL